jgi:hypothetical protein
MQDDKKGFTSLMSLGECHVDIDLRVGCCKMGTTGITVRLLGIRFKARNGISEPGPQEPYKDIALKNLSTDLQTRTYSPS